MKLSSNHKSIDDFKFLVGTSFQEKNFHVLIEVIKILFN